ncbi:DUF7344 domain-containing protein [Salinigranum salinum]|uniref:DUF7344 domain-containing protein n=1 Tax=Salinigranum salinum TaxID=1364937 RepID=UPI001260BFFD|nr:hypothetical protein [Salinigranum salinum]
MNGDDTSTVARGVIDHPYRRILLALLDGESPPVTVTDLAFGVFAYDSTSSDVVAGTTALEEDRTMPTSVVDALASQLHHTHLPRLAAAGVLQYDDAAGVVTDWSHPTVGDRWLTAPPVDDLAAAIADARSVHGRASD